MADQGLKVELSSGRPKLLSRKRAAEASSRGWWHSIVGDAALNSLW